MSALDVSRFRIAEQAKIRALDFDSRLVASVCYWLILTIVSKEYFYRFGEGSQSKYWYGVLKVFSFLPVNLIAFDAVYLFTLGVFFVAAIAPSFTWLRVLAFVTFMFLFNTIFASGKVNNHSFHINYPILFFMIFMTREKSLRNAVVLLSCQYVVLANYTASGFWKILGVLRELSLSNFFHEFTLILPNHLAYTFAEGNRPNLLNQFILNHAGLTSILWLLIMIIEFGAISAVFSKWAWRHWWKLLFALHLGSGLIMGIWFMPTAIMLVFLFAIAPYLRQSNAEELRNQRGL